MRRRIVIIVIVVAVVALGFVAFQMLGDGLGSDTVSLGQYAPGDYFTTNLQGSKRLFRTSVVLVVDSGEMDYLEQEHTRIRDTILFILSALDEEAATSLDTPDQLRREIKDALNTGLWDDGEERVVEVLFSEYVLQ